MFQIGSIRAQSYGHCVMNTLIFIAKNPVKKNLIITNLKKQISNKAIYEISVNALSEKHNVLILNNIVIYCLYRVIIKLMGLLPKISIFYANIELAHLSDKNEKYGSKYDFYPEKYLDIELNTQVPKYFDIQYKIWSKSNKLNNKKFICLFSRDNEYHHHNISNCRDSSFSSLIPTINNLIKLGYYVVRIGRNHTENVDIISDQYIDYDHSLNKSQAVDIMLLKKCDLLISSNSGINMPKILLGGNVLLHNWFPIGLRPHFKNCIYIAKKYKYNGKIIKYEEIPSDLLLCENTEYLKSRGFDIIDNTDSEILLFVSNYLIKNGKINTVNPSSFSFIKSGDYAMFDKNWVEANNFLFGEIK